MNNLETLCKKTLCKKKESCHYNIKKNEGRMAKECSCVPRASWSSCSGPQEALGTRMPQELQSLCSIQSFNLLFRGIYEPCTSSTLLVIPQMTGQAEVFGKQLHRKHNSFVHTSLFNEHFLHLLLFVRTSRTSHSL